MSVPALVLLALAWSGLAWAGAHLSARRCSPRTAQAVWRAAALLVPLPFILSLIVPALPAPAAAPLAELPVFEPFQVAPGADEGALATQTLALPNVATLIAALVAVGWAVRFGLWLISQVRLQNLKARAYPVRRPLRHWAEAMGLVRVPEVRIIPQGAPFLAGLRRPAVFLPASLAGREGDAEIIVHEMVHLKRGDLILRPLERLVADVFWFSPFAWAIRTQLDYWREAVVDEAAAELTGDRIAYARALTRAARLARPAMSLPVAALVLKQEGTLKMRLNLLLTDENRPRRLGLAALAVLACAAPLAIAQGVLIRGPGGMTAAAAPTIAYTHPVLDKAKLTSSFGVRKHPITGEQKLHGGVDLAEEQGKPIYAPTTGTVTRAEFDEGYGNLIEIAVGDTALRFGQLATIKVKAGDTVQPGDTIATLGQTGKATGPHLHLEVLRGGERVDPQAEEGLVLAETLRIQAGAAPLAPMPARETPQPTRTAPSAPSPLPAVIPASAPLSAVAARLAQPYASAPPAPAPDECPEAAKADVNASLNTPDPVS